MNILESMKQELETIWDEQELTVEQGTSLVSAYVQLLDFIANNNGKALSPMMTTRKDPEKRPLTVADKLDTLMRWI